MKLKLLHIIPFVFILLFFSCDDLSEQLLPPSGNYIYRTFWARDFQNGSHYQLTAELLAEGHYCNVWVERGSGAGLTAARRVANAYDTVVYQAIMDSFAVRRDFTVDGVEIVARNTMELADWMGDGDGKLAILILKIRDGHRPGINDTMVAGYFWSGNLFQFDPDDMALRFSNESDMIYIAVNPQAPFGSMESNVTIAHEMQHMMNFVTSYALREAYMDTWIDEGLSSAAEWAIAGSRLRGHAAWYNQDISGMIQRGNNFFVWDNHRSNPLAIIDDYATVYLFFQWLRLQAGSSRIYYDIISSPNSNFRAVTNAMNGMVPGRGYSNWDHLLRTWLAANYINAPTGPYGYMDDSVLRNIKATMVPMGIASVNLAPGEGVYSFTSHGFSLPAVEENIKYASVSLGSPWLSDSLIIPGGALLSFNANTNTRGRTEPGRTGGATVSLDAGATNGAGTQTDSLARYLPRGPFPISANDMLNRHGHQTFSNFRSIIRVIGDE